MPDQDTTISAYGGELRRYDIHVAKMFEVTHYLCQQNIARRTLKGFTWHYEAANGNVDMGRFIIACKLAREIVTAYGFSQTEQTAIRPPLDENGRFTRESDRPIMRLGKEAIPVLNITGSRIPTWINYVQKFRPLPENENKFFVGSPFPINEILPKIRTKTEVPILLPSTILGLPHYLHYEVCRADKSGYSFYNKFSGSCIKRPLTRDFDGFSAHKNGAFSSSSRLLKDTFRAIQLANGIEGIFSESCGTYCVSYLEWKYQGVLYRIKGRGEQQQDLVEMANSAIAAGPR
ncbi:MAG: hypothetical protein KME45_18045 [Stenomitos rutilans HA7619-LM2]|nr:hypothetical protein [Stenomitos rutilans HA7619-LM2]